MLHRTVNTSSLPGALQQLKAWSNKAKIEKLHGAISVDTIANLNRAYMVYKSKLINQGVTKNAAS